MSLKRALITGASGMLGRHLVTLLAERDINPISLGRTPVSGIEHHQLNDLSDTHFITSKIDEIKPDFLFHIAGTISASSQEEFFQVNAYFGKSLLEGITNSGLDQHTKIVFVGSAAEYGEVDEDNLPLDESMAANPFNDYGESKLLGTNLALEWGGDSRHIVVVRPFNILGSNLSRSIALGNFFYQIFGTSDNNPLVRTGNLNSCRDFIDVSDCANILLDLCQSPHANGQIVNACTGTLTPMIEILEYLISKSGKNVDHQIDRTLLRTIDPKQIFGSTKKLIRLTGDRNFIHWKKTIDRMIETHG